MIKKLIPCFLIDKYHFFLALLGSFLYGFPCKEIKVIGVTGTNGKSTTIDLITRVLQEAGFKVAALSSIKFKVDKKEEINKLRMTMPGRMILQKFLRQAVKAGCDYAILEVTSEGIKQHRHQFIDFDCAVFTNLHPEHIEAHGGFENYKKAKGEFFKAVKNIHIINLDDNHADYFLQFSAKKKYGYSINNKQQTANNKKDKKLFIVHCSLFTFNAPGISFEIEGLNFHLNLLGKFNIYNALAAICVGLSQGIDLAICQKALAKTKGIPGRMELVISEPFKVFVDYALTPNALEQVYQTLKTLNPKPYTLYPKMICVLGACGGSRDAGYRDKWKRPVLGELAAQYCDKVIVTNEDPYDENPNQILLDIKSGIPNNKIPMTNLILDRRRAIKEALKRANSGDVVIITGKGCEPSICVAGGKKIQWDDRRIVREEFKKVIGH